MPVISVIVPVYNVEKYLRRCIDSVLKQSYTDYEIILVDDGSPDRCPEICDWYTEADARISVIHKENGGLSSARNAGIDLAAGDYIFFLDADDMIHPDCLSILSECIAKTDADVAIGEFFRFDGNLESVNLNEKWNYSYYCKTNIQALETFFEARNNLHSIVSACGTLWKKTLFDDIRFPVGRLFEDEFTTYKLYYKANRIVFTDFRCYYYFINNNGITGTLNLNKRFDEYDAQWQRMMFFVDQSLGMLAGKAAYYFLRTAQWDLIAARNSKDPSIQKKTEDLEIQYKGALKIAKKQRLLKFLRDYDYYVLAHPNIRNVLRIKRFIMKHGVINNHKY